MKTLELIKEYANSTTTTIEWLKKVQLVADEENLLAKSKKVFLKNCHQRLKYPKMVKRLIDGEEYEELIMIGGVTDQKTFINVYWTGK